MTTEKEFETADSSEDSGSSPDYLQEKSDFVASLQQKMKREEKPVSLLDENIPYSQRAKDAADRHITQLEEALAGMRQREDYGIPNKDAQGNDLEGDMSFLDRPGIIPEHLKDDNQ